jgi:hypothetical protein
MKESRYPLEWPEGWPRTAPASRADYSRFRTTFHKAREDLQIELDRLGAVNIVISSWLPLRRDGLPRGDAARMRIDDPGVAVYFTFKGRRMVMARDAYSSVHDNLRSVGLAIEHLRGLERHGGGDMMERAFEGFEALPPPSSDPNSEHAHWSVVLGVDADAHLDVIHHAYRTLSKEAHPDNGGDATKFARLSRAYEQAKAEYESL